MDCLLEILPLVETNPIPSVKLLLLSVSVSSLSTVCYEFHKYGLVKEVKELTVKQYKYLYFQSRQQGDQ